MQLESRAQVFGRVASRDAGETGSNPHHSAGPCDAATPAPTGNAEEDVPIGHISRLVPRRTRPRSLPGRHLPLLEEMSPPILIPPILLFFFNLINAIKPQQFFIQKLMNEDVNLLIVFVVVLILFSHLVASKKKKKKKKKKKLNQPPPQELVLSSSVFLLACYYDDYFYWNSCCKLCIPSTFFYLSLCDVCVFNYHLLLLKDLKPQSKPMTYFFKFKDNS